MDNEANYHLTVIDETSVAANDADSRERWEQIFDEVFYADDTAQSDSVLPSNQQ